MRPSNESGGQRGRGDSAYVSEFVDRFEDAWQRGQRPAIGDYLPADGPKRRVALRELVHVDLERRFKAGELVRVETYLVCYPELVDEAVVVVDLLAAEYELRRRQESGLSLTEYLRRFPQHGDALRAHLRFPADDPASAEQAAVSDGKAKTLPPHPSPDSDARTLPPAPASLLEDPFRTRVTPRPAETAAAAPVAQGPSVPGYEILGELGRGAMGVVYQARQIKLNRLVALKMILAGAHAGEHELARFRTEAEAVARLQHPNVVQIHEVGEADGKPFFSLEYCDGGSLAAKLDGTPLPPQDAARLVETLARAIDAAHCAGIVHRDLKPANILLQIAKCQVEQGQSAIRTLQSATPKITDFGLAKKLDSGSGQTASGAIVGTPSYMAPEQAGGHSKEVGPLADVYALGAILYELLTGRPPFKAAAAMDTLLLVLSEEPVPPRRLQPKVPVDLETIALKCLQKEPSKRYSSAATLADDLRRFLAREPIVTRPVGRLERVGKWARRRPALASLVAVSVLAVLVLGGVAAYFTTTLAERNRRLGEEVERAEQSKQEARHQATEAGTARKQAEQERETADRQRDRAERLVYAGQLGLAQREWQDNHAALAKDLLDSCQWDLCGWEHHYLNSLFNGLGPRTLRGHSVSVNCVCFSRDGRHLASASRDGTVKVWDAATGREVLSFNEHTDVWSVSFSPDGGRLASASGAFDPGKSVPGRVKVWDAARQQMVLSFTGHTNGVTSVCFSPDGQRLASASRDHTVKVWDAATGRELLSLQGHTDPVTGLCFSPDGKRLASASGDFYGPSTHPRWGEVKVWDASTGQVLLSLKGHALAVTSVCFSPDGRRLASASWDKTVKVWDAATGREVFTLQGHTGHVNGVCFSPDGQRLASASQDQMVKVWDAATGQHVLSVRGHTSDVTKHLDVDAYNEA
jgi:serine/threonine protein kinase/sugar lactone lactonase YvrE